MREGDEVEWVNLPLCAFAPAAQARVADLFPLPSAAERGIRRTYFGQEHGHCETPVLTRGALGRGSEGAREGPLIIEDPDTTVVVPPKWNVHLGADGVLALERI